jgi:DNA polymerase III subunit chi
MPELWFYHLERESAHTLLPQLLRRGLERGLRLCVETTTPELVRHWSNHLWGYEDTGFLPHGLESDRRCADQPIWLTNGEANPNNSTFRFYVDGAVPSAAWLNDNATLQRASVLFEAANEQSLQAARSLWKEARSAGMAARYQQQNESGGWGEVAASGA